MLPYLNIPLNSVNFGFPNYITANLNTPLSNVFAIVTETVGKIGQLSSINPGLGYDASPIVKVVDSLSEYGIKGNQILNFANLNLFFTTGEMISQNNGAKGLVVTSNNTSVTIQRITFEDLFTVNAVATGIASGASATITEKIDVVSSNNMGLNAVVSANVITSTGSITGLLVTDSGYGYLNSEDVTLSKNNYSFVAEARVVSKKQGISHGHFESNDGFLSDKDHIYDGFYYQDYSYVVRTSLSFDKYADILKNIIHVAGTQAFFEIAFETFIDKSGTVSTEIANA